MIQWGIPFFVAVNAEFVPESASGRWHLGRDVLAQVRDGRSMLSGAIAIRASDPTTACTTITSHLRVRHGGWVGTEGGTVAERDGNEP